MVLPTPPGGGTKKRWSSLLPVFVALVVVAEISFLGRLDMAKNAALVHHWTKSFYFPSSPQYSSSEGFGPDEEEAKCREWLEREDAVAYKRDFRVDPVLVSNAEQDWSSCSVDCKFGFSSVREPDAVFGVAHDPVMYSVHRSMESSHYYAENNLDHAQRRGYNVVMTTSLSSDVPVGYFSWAEYDIMAPLQPKMEDGLAAAFISNCGARNFRLQALDLLEKANIKIDSYGACHRNRDGKGAVPVVVGAPNIQDFAPSPGSVLHIRELSDVNSVAEKMKYLAANPEAYNQSLRWKFVGPSDSFKALVDMAAVHSSCRLCIHLATKIREKEEMSPEFKKRPCKCTNKGVTLYHLFVRERGTFEMESIFLRSSNLTMGALESAVVTKFKSRSYVPIWKKERPESLRGGDLLKVYRIYPVGITQRRALYTFRFNGDADLRKYVGRNPCAKLEVIFV
uniref:Fucosyltransferase n=1 Tax=Anthurium amnicola TaxID=1678845 RepID=A0A1D1XD26_9ARAE